jgi:hypothetical protein
MGVVAYELILALVAIAAITAGYMGLAQHGAPQPSSFWGHTLGIVGFLMMLSTETLYSLRKRVPSFHLGRMSLWLQAHIFTGLVGAYLVFLHAAWKFHGLAGALALLTGVVVVSGIVGRYIYTAVPRTLEGVEVAFAELEDKIAGADQRLQKLGGDRLRQAVMVAAAPVSTRGWFIVLARPFLRRRQRRRWQRLLSRLDETNRGRLQELQTALSERQRLQMQVDSWDATRRMLALWHMFHVPLSGALFTLAFIHIFAALYYGTLMK